MTVRVGVIGAGRIGKVHAETVTYRIPEARVVAIADIKEETARRVAEQLHIPLATRDYREILRDVFCELGRGAVNFPAVRDALIAMNYDGWIVVEQDVLPSLGSPKESARRNREYLRSIGM